MLCEEIGQGASWATPSCAASLSSDRGNADSILHQAYANTFRISSQARGRGGRDLKLAVRPGGVDSSLEAPWGTH